jgi:uncharacterized membrane protein
MPKPLVPFIQVLAGLALIVTWNLVVALIVRPFGVRLPFRLAFHLEESTYQDLTVYQYVSIFGVLHLGCAMFLWGIAWGYLDWKCLDGPYSLSGNQLLRSGVGSLVLGIVFGLLTRKKKTMAPHQAVH